MSKLTSIGEFAILIEFIFRISASNAYGACPGNRVEVYRDHLGIEEKFSPSQKLEQRNLGVCWAFSLTYLLEYLHRSTEPSSGKSSISPMSVLMETCPNQLKFSEGASLGAPLRRLRYFQKTARFASADAFNYKKIAKLLKPKSLDKWVTASCEVETASLLSYVNKQSIALGLEISLEKLGQKVTAQPEDFHFDVLSPIYQRHIELPTFEEVKLRFSDLAEMEKNIKDHFARDPSQGGKSPIAVALKDPPHAVVFSGYRQACCGEVCRSQVKIENWHGEHDEKSKWEDIHNLDGKVGDLMIIRPCHEGLANSNSLERCAEIDPDDMLMALISGRNESEVRSFLKDLPEKSKTVLEKMPNERRRSIVLYAIRKGMPEVASFLVKDETFWSNLNDDGQNLLHEAAEEGDQMTVQYLVKKGISVNLGDVTGATPLGYAAFYGNADVVRALIDATPKESLKGAVEHQDKTGWTPLLVAVMNGHLGAVELLLKHGPNLMHKDIDNQGLCHYLSPDEFMTGSWLEDSEKGDRAEQIKNLLRDAYLEGKIAHRYSGAISKNLPCLAQ